MPEQLYRKRFIISLIILIFLIPGVLVWGVVWGDRNYGLTAAVIVILSMLPFFMVFEHRRPQAREIVPIAVMTALAVVSRVAFLYLPQVKPILAVVMICGFAFGAESGFVCGACAMLVSNFFFGQGPWTPWQMLCCGLIGFVSGALSRTPVGKNRYLMAGAGLVAGYVYGLIVDVWTILGFSQSISWASVLAVYVPAMWFNTLLAITTALLLFICGMPFIKKLNRLKVKYGLLGANGQNNSN